MPLHTFVPFFKCYGDLFQIGVDDADFHDVNMVEPKGNGTLDIYDDVFIIAYL
jgi:hypothetical protein